MSENGLSKSKRRELFLAYAPFFLWIGVIFFFSSQLGAASNTSRFIRPVLEWFFPAASAETITLYHTYVRKFAHFAAYAVLAFFAARVFWISPREVLRKYWYLFSFLTVVSIASLDELNQSLTTARTGSVYDILLDVSGGLTMIFVILAIRHFKKN